MRFGFHALAFCAPNRCPLRRKMLQTRLRPARTSGSPTDLRTRAGFPRTARTGSNATRVPTELPLSPRGAREPEGRVHSVSVQVIVAVAFDRALPDRDIEADGVFGNDRVSDPYGRQDERAREDSRGVVGRHRTDHEEI